ncbi:ATP-binding cassette domain-containing protein [Dysgonomonas sp. GY617]|uniref:ATP-binding cassette domain-containing protein n=1 Tax=Dysgonomonas sp. GY617 TaxID=2780420 RepID=UPI0018845DFD|nr:ATP-binding cassette domain-containing protein [Dysgonomonas sp. GY617]MBF0575458.1 ATP-binding cassette domain-containing protein [Dysgonomonas sp. GY617]
MDAITTTNLNYKYKKQRVLDHIDLSVPIGSIYGYLGKNGAGKSTTIKLLLGLLKSPVNSIFYEDDEFNNARMKNLGKIGSLIESPCFYQELTAYENLKYLDFIFKCGENRILEILSLVGLNEAKDKKVKRFSTGMKQRLGIAMAIFHDPDILILDEPLNGLDPHGIHDIRELILKLNKQGKTVFLSSHLLTELEKICTHFGILDQGILIYQGKKEDLLLNLNKEIVIKVNNPEKALLLCEQQSFKVVSIFGNVLKIRLCDDNEQSSLLKSFISNNIEIYSMESQALDLETVFLTLTSKK